MHTSRIHTRFLGLLSVFFIHMLIVVYKLHTFQYFTIRGVPDAGYARYGTYKCRLSQGSR